MTEPKRSLDGSGSNEGHGDLDDGHQRGEGVETLSGLYQQVVKALGDVTRAPPGSAEQQVIVENGKKAVQKAVLFIQNLNVFSLNEEYTEHSTLSLRYVALPFFHAELVARTTDPTAERAMRDRQRIATATEARRLYRQYLQNLIDLEFPFADREVLEYPLTSEEGARRDRDAKMAHFSAIKGTKATISELEAAMKAAGLSDDGGDDDGDDEILRAHMLSLLHQYMLQAIDQIEMLGNELAMLKQIVRQRMEGKEALSFEQLREKEKQERKGPPKPPMVLTAEKVKEMCLTQQTINRGNFKLLTAGYGPIGAPTMTLDQVADMELKQALEAQEREKAAQRERDEFDSDTEEGSIVRTYELRERDEYRDHHKAGEGNRYNKG